MDKNFRLGQSNEIVREDRVFDLHNLYDCSGLSIGAERTAQMCFQPNPEHGAGQPCVLLEFDEIDHLEVCVRLGTRLSEDLDEMGYMSPDQHDAQWLLNEEQATEADHLYFRLGAGFVRIHAQRARLHIRE